MSDFCGDVLLRFSDDGADIVFEDGGVKSCDGIETAVVLSLFSASDWWGNYVKGTKKNEKIKSDFCEFLNGAPLTSGNLVRARKAAQGDLKWICDEKAAQKVNVSLRALGAKSAELSAEIVVNEKGENQAFLVNW